MDVEPIIPRCFCSDPIAYGVPIGIHAMSAPEMSSALTSLLNSLHTQIQAQTQLLPALHAQLGLPPTTLEDELRTLQKHLIQTVETQIHLRQKEVQRWMEKCEVVEVEYIRYSKALGANVKATQSSVGELRKEMVLPRRFEMVSEHQEKLRQVSEDHFSLTLASFVTVALSGVSY